MTVESALENENAAVNSAAGTDWSKRLFFVVVIATAFWFIDHDLGSSDAWETRMDYQGVVNRTADRVENVNRYSTVARFSLGIFGAAWILLSLGQTQIRWKSLLLCLCLAYVSFWIMSVLWSVNPKLTILKTGSLVFFSLAALGLARQLTLKDLMIVFTSTCVIYIFISLAVEIVSGNFKPGTPDYRFVGACHPNILGSYAAVCCLGAGVYSSGRGRISLLTILVFGIGVVTLYLTKSRTSLIGLMFAMLAMYTITLKPGTRILAISLFALLMVAAAGFLAVSGGKTWSSAGGMVVMGRTENVKTMTGRIPLWEELLESVEERPVLGHGYLAFWDKDRVERLSEIFGWEIPHGHNMYIDVLLDGGMVGLMLMLAVLLTGLAVSFLRYKERRAIGIAFAFAMIVYVLLHGMGESLFKLHTFLSLMLVSCLLRVGSLKPVEEQ